MREQFLAKVRESLTGCAIGQLGKQLLRGLLRGPILMHRFALDKQLIKHLFFILNASRSMDRSIGCLIKWLYGGFATFNTLTKYITSQVNYSNSCTRHMTIGADQSIGWLRDKYTACVVAVRHSDFLRATCWRTGALANCPFPQLIATCWRLHPLTCKSSNLDDFVQPICGLVG